MTYFIQGESVAGVFNARHHHVPGADVTDFNILLRVKVASVLHGIQQHLAKRHTNVVAFFFRKITDLAHELHQPVCGDHSAAHSKCYQMRCCGNKLDAIGPVGSIKDSSYRVCECLKRIAL